MEEQTKEVLIIQGFLEAGKTTYINKLLGDLEEDGKKILLLSCESGEIEYAGAALARKNVILEEIPQEEWKCENLTAIVKKHASDQIILESNGMWKQFEAQLPGSWNVASHITIMDASTLAVYLNNMRSQLGGMLRQSDRIYINRCDEKRDLVRAVKAQLRPLVKDPAQTILEGPGGICTLAEVKDTPPYDPLASVIQITEEDYVYWYYDCRDERERYEGRRVCLEGNIKKLPFGETGEFTFGKVAMTCCELDMSFLGYLARYENIEAVPQLSRVRIEAVVTYKPLKSTGEILPYLEVDQLEVTRPGIESWDY